MYQEGVSQEERGFFWYFLFRGGPGGVLPPGQDRHASEIWEGQL